jgi:adenylylsulfate kinase
VSDPYEPPAAPELTLRTNEEEPQDSARRVIEKLEELGYLEPAKEYGRRAS